MLWFFPSMARPPDPGVLHSVVARSIAAQERAGAAAEGVGHAADEHRERVEAVVGAMKVRTERRLRSRDQTLEQLLARDL